MHTFTSTQKKKNCAKPTFFFFSTDTVTIRAAATSPDRVEKASYSSSVGGSEYRYMQGVTYINLSLSAL